jgi:hypothetical protein
VNDEGVGWAFLVARGRHKGFRTLLAPDFMVRAHRQYLLSERVGEDRAGSGETSVVRIDDEREPLTISFRAEPAVAEMINSAPADRDGVLTDRHGRPLELLYGIVTRGHTGPVGEGDLDLARAEALASYRSFRSDEDGFAVRAAKPRVLQEAPTVLMSGAGASTRWPPPPEPVAQIVGPAEAPRPVRTPAVPPGPGDRVVVHPLLAAVRRPVVIASLALLGIVLVAMRMLDEDVHVTLTIEPDGSRVSCDERRTLVADIEVDEPMEITYRWRLQKDDGELVPLPDTGAEESPDEPDQDNATGRPAGVRPSEDAAEPERSDSEPWLQKTPPKSGRKHDNEGGHDFDRAGSTQVKYSIESSAPNATYVLEVTNTDSDARPISEQLKIDCQRR